MKRGQGPFAFRWLKNGEDLDGTDRVALTVVSERMATMTIRGVVPQDSGNYSCVASNVQGKDVLLDALSVRGKYPVNL